MAFLRVIQGAVPGQILELRGERTALGRHPNCQIVLDNAAVSRYHAQILESHGNYYLEDLRSRNRTYLNGQPVEGRTLVNDSDTIKVCDVVFSFHLRLPTAAPPPTDAVLDEASRIEVRAGDPEGPYRTTLPDRPAELELPLDSGEPAEGSSVISTLDVRTGSSKLRLHVRPEAKLRAVLEISNSLVRVLDPDEILQKILDGLFKIFPQADAGFALLRDPVPGRTIAQQARTRKPGQESELRISMTLANQAIESREAILSADVVRDPLLKPSDSMREMRVRSTICAPLVNSEGQVLGVIQVNALSAKDKFVQDDLDVLVSVCSQAALAVENARLHEQMMRQREVQRDLEVATQIQLGFLPNRRPKLDAYEFADYYEAAQSVGGDYFDYVVLRDGRVAIAVADVAGKGIPAALLMARLYSAARFHLLTNATVAEAMTGLNAEIASSGLGFRFITCVLAILDPGGHELTIANAGHQPPLLRGDGTTVTALGGAISGMPLGVTPCQKFRQETVRLRPRDTVIVYTDGITEAMNPDRDLYGSKLLAAYVASGPAGSEDLVKGIVGDVERFSGGQPQRDDRCLVCIRRLE